MMSDNDLSKKLSEIQDTKPRMSDDPEIELGPSRMATPPKAAKGTMWPMYLCCGMLLVILLFALIPRGS